MKVIKLRLGGTYTAYGKVFKNGEEETVSNEKADYLVATSHFELVREVEKKEKEK
ncbi:YqbF domain-containing protein [Bacillus manliponensis]|uniref:YqbF domain-containing protein n=1 Tax=Bacillus manliponensis TaxID=574376 RepID=UPI0009FDE306|nr:YqbF domain-containing protein [Bacillus manliponensis]